MSTTLTDAQRQELRDAFDTFDAGRFPFESITLSDSCGLDGSGRISSGELAKVFRALNIKVNEDQLNDAVARMDSNESGTW
jgi:Ca2+-binding EF-hand superfamily protein